MEEILLDIKASVFKWLRESSGFSIEDVARILKKDINEIRKWEEKDSKIPLKYIDKLAMKYGVTREAFFLNQPISEEFPNDFRKEVGPLKNESIRAIRKARYLQYIIRNIRVEEEKELARYSIEDDPEDIASIERNHLINSIDYVNRNKPEKVLKTLINNLERKGIFVFQLEMPLDNVRGFSFSKYPYIIVINEKDTLNGKIFTLLHEYAHLLLRKSGICMPKYSWDYKKKNIEKWCNNFAASILLPKEIIESIDPLQIEKNIEGLGKLSTLYKASKYTIAIRLMSLFKGDERLENILQQTLNKLAEEAKEYVKKKEEPLFAVEDIPLQKSKEIPVNLKKFLEDVKWIDNAKIYREDFNIYIERLEDPNDKIVIKVENNKAILKIYDKGSITKEIELRVKSLDKTLVYKPFIPNIINERKVEMGELFIKTIMEAYKKELITTHELLEYLELKTKHIEKLKKLC